ncbi:hypothetical protein PMG11_11081 [Penicillium brasilianum]|uniref:Uncharacterized protein n=1 Tax=Penicillium brasilianum TaxID=104259 RepID=A0A0F7U0Y0_PENBI|nr:hypothetical protein PMG11_11081 [Penicillium brasilianum]
MDWFKDGSVLESEVEVFTRNPTIEPYSVIKPNMSDKPPDGGWRTTSWQDFEEFTRLVCDNQGHSSHTLNSIPSMAASAAAIQVQRCEVQQSLSIFQRPAASFVRPLG